MYSLYVLVVRGLVGVDEGDGEEGEDVVLEVAVVVPLPLLLALLAWPSFSLLDGLLAGLARAVNSLKVDLLFLRTRSCLIMENRLLELLGVGVGAAGVVICAVVLHANCADVDKSRSQASTTRV